MNGRLIRDRLIQHAMTEAYRNILPPTVYPVVLLFLEMPSGEVDVNVHPSKTEVRFRQQSVMHDFVRDSIRAALMKARPVPQFVTEINAHPTASPSLTGARSGRGGFGTRGIVSSCRSAGIYAASSDATADTGDLPSAWMASPSTATPRSRWFALRR